MVRAPTCARLFLDGHHCRPQQRTSDGTTRDVSYQTGQTRHLHFEPDEYLLHDIENTGDTELVFTTVELLDSDNTPLPL
jgi:hypothetical protein